VGDGEDAKGFRWGFYAHARVAKAGCSATRGAADGVGWEARAGVATSGRKGDSQGNESRQDGELCPAHLRIPVYPIVFT